MNKTVKVGILGLLVIIGFIVFGWFEKLVFSSDLGWIARGILFTLGFMIALGAWGLMAYFIKNRWAVYFITLMSLLVLSFFLAANIYYLACLGIIFFSSIFAIERIRTDQRNRIKVMLYESTSAGLKSVLAACCLLVSLNFYYSPLSQIREVHIPQRYQEKILSYLVPDFSPDMTVDELVYALLAKEQGIKNADLADYVAGQKIEVRAEDFANYKNTVLEKLKLSSLNLTGQEKVSEVEIFQHLFEEEIQAYLTKYEKLVRLATSLLLFITIVGLWHLFYPLIYLFLWSLYRLLVASGFVKIIKEQVEAERAEI